MHNATNQSLVLLDEIGRGTATYDGLSIAWAVSEFLAKEIQCKTIFATHYHELNNLSKILSNVRNYQVLVEEKGEDLLFLHHVVSGGACKSYGIKAARLAGVPQIVVDRAQSVFAIGVDGDGDIDVMSASRDDLYDNYVDPLPSERARYDYAAVFIK